MKTKSLYLTVMAAILFVAGSIIFAGCGNCETENENSHEHQQATETEHNHDMDDGHEHDHGDMAEAHYQCPMKCEEDKTYDKPGNCPVCKMELEEVDNHSGHDH